MQCQLCESSNIFLLEHKNVKYREFYICQNCDLIFQDPKTHVSLMQEKNRYSLHNNELNDGYFQFLSQAIEPLEKLNFNFDSNSKILDYGCGPTQILKEILKIRSSEKSLNAKISAFDPYFFQDNDIFNSKWDLIFSTEVWEHFREPKNEIEKCVNLLATHGILVVMTQFHSEMYDFNKQQSLNHFFESWWYTKDFTHIAFYSHKTWLWLAKAMSIELIYNQDPVVIFKKKNDQVRF